MARRDLMTYQDAVKLLAKDDSAVIDALDQVLGLGLLAVTAFRPECALPYFDAKNELIDRLRGLTASLKERMRASTRLRYEELLVAAHAVIVMTAFTEELTLRLRELDEDGRWSRELRHWQDTGKGGGSRRRQLVTWSAESTIEPPGPTRPFDVVAAEIGSLYSRLGAQVMTYLKGLRRWDELDETQQGRIEHSVLSRGFAEVAAGRYSEHFLRLAAQVPEFLAWTLLNEHAATRAAITSLAHRDAELQSVLARLEERLRADSAALEDLPKLLAQLNGPTGGEELEHVADCHRLNRRILANPLLSPRLNGDLEQIRFPPIREGYVNPDFRLLETGWSDEGRRLAQEETWEGLAVRSGLGGFLAAYLRSARATRKPLLVLGDPGSGKSLLSKILAAQLPPDEFAVARVELRHVRASQEVGDQIDLELRRHTNNRYQLQDLTDQQGRITRVVIMDGLDELLQLSAHEGLARYLERLEHFQEVEAELGRPVIAVATARTIVMDRMYVPKQSVVIKLEGFSGSQIETWIATWNRENAAYFRRRNLAELSVATLERHADLARQPLLLALLALYDAEGNFLRNAGDLDQARLYERIFRRYLERELEKKELPPREGERSELVEQRFRELSTIAVGMLNRGRRFITHEEVERDFVAKEIHRGRGGSVPAVDDAVGQFFFLYRAQAQDRETTFSYGYEFMHATFGEFLAARLLAQQLTAAVQIVRTAPAWDRRQAERHALALLVPYLAQRPLVREEQVMIFLESIVGERVSGKEAAQAIAAHLPALMRSGLGPAGPPDQGHLERLATLTLNLVLVTLLISGRSIELRAFHERDGEQPQDARPFPEWRQLLALWKAHLPADDWAGVLGFLNLTEGGTLVLGERDDPGLSGLVARDTSSHLGRLVAEGRLAGDVSLSVAASLWYLVSGGSDHRPRAGSHGSEDEGADALITLAVFRSMSGQEERTLLPERALQGVLRRLAAEPESKIDLLAQVMGGPASWSDRLLLLVATFVADHDDLVIASLPTLLRLVAELDRRGQFAILRRLLERVPEIEAGAFRAADIAALISLLRRHQLRGPLHPAVSIEYIISGPLTRLSVDDLAWILQHGGFGESDLRLLAACLKQDPRLMHALDKARSVTAWLEEGAPAPE